MFWFAGTTNHCQKQEQVKYIFHYFLILKSVFGYMLLARRGNSKFDMQGEWFKLE
jgi:hypothetical protein